MRRLDEVAYSYIGTPHINGAMVKGAGVDCCTLIVLIFNELGANIEVKLGYSADWFCKKDCQEILLPYLEKYFMSGADIIPGAVLSYSWGRAKYAHLALYLGGGKVIHCQADKGVEVTEITDPYFFKANGQSRVTGVWRLKDEFLIQR